MPPNIEQVQAADLWQHRLYLSEVLRSFSSYDVSHQEDWFLIQLNRSFVIGYVRQVLCWAVERRCTGVSPASAERGQFRHGNTTEMSG